MSVLHSAEEVEATVIKFLREVMPWRLANKEISHAMFLQKDLGIDSMGLVALAFRFEEEFGVDLEEFPVEVADIRQVGDVVALARNMTLAAKKSA
ncbi:MAG: acyl carrier protein [Pyrinomonadaceae bacterium]